MSTQTAPGTYSERFLPGQPVQQSHPDRLATTARLFGLDPPPIDRCRVLEIGTAGGGNLLPMAVRHPDSTFVGIDESPELIAAALRTARAMNMNNLDFRAIKLSEIDAGLGKFDYILCHGLYSRVHPEAQTRLLALCRAHLQPRGVAYMSFRAQPGWVVPSIVREIVDGTADRSVPLEQAVRARRVMEFLVKALARDPSPYAWLLREEARRALHAPGRAFVHEHFEGESHPLYFHEFVDRAAGQGLRYLGDAELNTMFVSSLGTGLHHNLLQMAGNQVALEQHMDVLRNRAFHRSLICHHELAFDHVLSPAGIERLFIAGNLRAENPASDPLSDAEARFVTALGAGISSASPPVKIALGLLAGAWPRSVPFVDLLQTAIDRLSQTSDAGASAETARAMIKDFVVGCLTSGLLDAHSAPDRFVAVVSERPCACPWARAQALTSSEVTNRRHRQVVLDSMSQNLLRLLDGTRDRGALLDVVVEAVGKGQVSILLRGMPASQQETTAPVLQQAIELSLAQLAASALLIS